MMSAAGGAAPPRSSTARWLAAACAAVLCLGFIALGTWQLYRLQWKLALIERVDARVHAPAIAAPLGVAVSKEADEYRHVFVEGHYLAGADALVQATTIHGSGFWLLTPFCTNSGAIVMINRGFVPPSHPKPAPGATARCTPGASVDKVAGLLRLPEVGGGYLRDNDPVTDRWFSRDVAAIAASRKLGAVAPWFLDREADANASPDATGEPIGGLTVIKFTNSHLVYALTWYALALGAAAGGWLLLRRRAP